ncbi:hypothetical protein HJFPF1_01424 [Paramyrothecium foliicola]|nr:hypothetical protein HJFPF1_01424 [Paramyrothecium foliicola]
MPTAKSQYDNRRQKETVTKEETYLGSPPTDRTLVEARIVLPGKHLLPVALDDLGALDELRKEYKVWIAKPEPHVLVIYAEAILALKKAFVAVNNWVCEMRLANENVGTRFIVQPPTRAGNQDKVTFNTRSRPYIPSPSSNGDRPLVTQKACLSRLYAKAEPSFETLMALEQHLQMRVQFGHIVARNRMVAETGSGYSYDDLANMACNWSRRGRARLETRLQQAQLANDAVAILTDPEHGLCCSQDDHPKCTLVLFFEDALLQADITILAHGNPQISNIKMKRMEHCARLNWTVTAPDMHFDWSLRVDASEIVDRIPDDVLILLQKKIRVTTNDYNDDQGLLRFPQLSIYGPIPDNLRIFQSQIRMSTVMPIRDTPYAVEISTTRTWKNLEVNRDADAENWGAQAYGVHWDEAINYVKPGSIRRDWGDELKYMWPGKEPSLQRRYEDFLQCILEVQQALENVVRID